MLSGVVVLSLLSTSPQEHWGTDVHVMYPTHWGFWGATLKSPDFAGSVLCPLSHRPIPTPLSPPPSLLPSLSPCSHKHSIYSQILNYFKISNYIHLCIRARVSPLCTCVYIRVRVCICVAEVRGQLVGIVSLLISPGSKGSSSGCQVRQQVSSLTCSQI